MQNSYTTDVINLKSYNISEADKIIVMYSKDKGLIKGIARGIKKTKSKLGARMDMLVANTVMLHKGKTFNTICQAECLNTFKQTRSDLDKIFYSMYLAEIVNNFGLEGDPSSKTIYKLLYEALESISKAENKKDVLLTVIKFQLKIMRENGFSIELDNCLVCGKNIKDAEKLYFVIDSGGIICEECENKIRYGKKLLHIKLRDFLKQMSINTFATNEYYEQKANEQVCDVIFRLLKEYIDKKCPKQIKTTKLLS